MAGDLKTKSDLRWIEEDVEVTSPEEFVPFKFEWKTVYGLFVKKSTENILVPIGLLATTTCLTLGLVNMMRGNSNRQQVFMRGRVAFQGMTLLAMAAVPAIALFKKQLEKFQNDKEEKGETNKT